MWNVIVTFAAVVLIIYLSYVCSKYIGKGMNRGGNSKYMRMLDRLAVGQDRYVAVVQAGEKYLLIGVTQEQVNLLKELTEEELIALNPDSGISAGKPTEFREMMSRLRRTTKKER